jgi:hypothetical protein
LSEIRATTISDTAGTGPVTLTKQSAAKAWCYFNTNSPTSITGSYNVSSLTDNGVGNTDVIITNSMSSTTSFSMQVTSNNFQTHNSQIPSATSFNVYTSNASGVAGDGGRNYLLVHGDLA